MTKRPIATLLSDGKDRPEEAMNISLGIVEWEEWEENERSAPGTLGKKLAVALSIVGLAAMAMGSWLSTPDLSSVSELAPASAEVALVAE